MALEQERETVRCIVRERMLEQRERQLEGKVEERATSPEGVMLRRVPVRRSTGSPEIQTGVRIVVRFWNRASAEPVFRGTNSPQNQGTRSPQNP